MTIGGPFTLTATDGTTVTDGTYRGKWLLVYFGYTSCPNTCPTVLIEIGTALATLGADAGKLQPLFITVDPQRDTAELLREYLQSFDPRIIGLTGTRSKLPMRPRNMVCTPPPTGSARAPKITSSIIAPTFT